jgi:energy-coupling factor transporter ATP-binding protein EcfA2
MKISAIHLENFKQFEHLDIEVRNSLTGEIAKRFLLLGDNGTGKTTILQAIALTLSMAFNLTRNIESFNWIGWLASRYKRWGMPIVELTVHFSEPEIQATKDISKRWYDGLHETERQSYVEPTDSEVVTLRLQGSYCSTPNQPKQIEQFRGRYYARLLLNQGDYQAGELIERLPGFFWFDQFRDLATVSENLHTESRKNMAFHSSVSELRQTLNSWLVERILSQRSHYYDKIENWYQKLFPGRQFAKPEPMYEKDTPTPSSHYFMLTDGQRTYDIEEMSSGEQALFPILFQFVYQQIDHSVILIDEIDLNLHPPLAQAFFAFLPKMGPNCQFLYTTHSEVISRVANPHQIYRMKKGDLCLSVL